MAPLHPTTAYKGDVYGASNGVTEVTQSPWAEYFGTPLLGTQLPEYDPRSQETWTLPEALKGTNLRLRDVTEFLVYSDENFYTGRVMPIRIVNQAKVSWRTTTYAPQRPTHVPELGVTRILRSGYRGGSATLERLGLGVFFENGFMHHPQGQRHFTDTMRQLALSITEFAKFDVMHTLLTSNKDKLAWERKHGTYKNKRLEELFEDQLWMWACLQKSKNSIAKLDAKVTSWMRRWRGRADTWIFPPEVQVYLSLVPKERTDYYLAGASGPERVRDGLQASIAVGGKDVFFARTYDIEEAGPVDLLSATAQIGEYNEMRDRERDSDYSQYRSKNRHVEIYDEDGDTLYEARLTWALNACQRFDQKGELIVDGGEFAANTEDLGQEAERDVFTYLDGDSQRQTPIRLFGQMEEDYFPAKDKINLARTAVSAVRRRWNDSGKSLDKAWQEGTALVDEIDALGYSDELVAAAAASAEGSAVLIGDEAADATAAKARGLSAGFQSYQGLKAIAASGKEKANVAKEFVRAIDDLTPALRDIFPGSYLLDPRFASPWWSEKGSLASVGDVFFENAVARSRVRLFYVGDTSGSKDDEAAGVAYGRVYAQQLSKQSARQGGAKTAPLPTAEEFAAFSPGAKEVAIAAAALLGGVGLLKDELADAQPAVDRYVQVDTEIRRLVKGSWAAPKVSRAQLVEATLKMQQVFGNAAKLRAALANIFEEQLVSEPGKQKGSIQYGAEGAYKKTKLLAGPALVRQIAQRVADGKKVEVLPASPGNPEVPISLGELRRMAARFAQNAGGGDVDDEYADADKPASSLAPAFDASIASELSPHVEHLALVIGGEASASAGAQDAYLGDEFEENGGGGGGRYGRLAQQRRARREGPIDEAKSEPMKRAFKEVQRAAGGDRLLASVAHVYDFTPVRKLAFERFIARDVVLPIAFAVVRPHASYNMLTAICCLSGADMGEYFHAHGRFELGTDPDTQSTTGSYTYKSKAAVTNADHVLVARNIFSNGCLGGLGTALFTPEKYVLNGAHNGRESVFVLAVPYASNELNGQALSLSGVAELNGTGFSLQARNKLDYIGVKFYNSLWGWRSSLQNDESGALGTLDQISEKVYKNLLCFRGLTIYFSPSTQKFDVAQLGNGHWSKVTYPGCKAVRSGQLEAFEPENHFQGYIKV